MDILSELVKFLQEVSPLVWQSLIRQVYSDAQEHVVNADRRAKELFATRHSIEKGANEFDPDMSMDYTGTSYFIYTVPLAKKKAV